MHVVATAGHVDHGKSTLVEALTGMDPDRFAEEKARGLTIDIGFAWTTLPSGRELAFVDVPGHVRFIKNMLAGVGAVDACMFVVDATEGWKPQSEEHLRILELLGVERGIITLTKVAVADPETAEIAALDAAERTAGSFLEDAPVVPVDAITRVGLDDVRHALDELLAGTPESADRGRPRLWIDRSFAARGSGTVVTGTLAGGTLQTGEELVVEPAGHRVRIRALQSHGAPLVEASPGRRLAVNLTGIGHDDVRRGDALVRRGQWKRTARFDGTFRVLPALAHEVSRRGAYNAHIGSGEFPVRLRVLGADAIRPGEEGLVRVHLPLPLPLGPGDRFVVRESGRGETVGGGEVLDVAPVLAASRARPSRSLEEVIAQRGWVDVGELELLTHERRRPDAGHWAIAPTVLEAERARVRALVDDAGALGLDVSRLDERERAVLATIADIEIVEGRARPSQALDPLAEHPFVAALEAAPFTPPSARDSHVDPAEVRALVHRRLVVERDGFHFAPSAIDRASATIAALLTASPDGVTVSEIREALGTTRKYLLPLLAHLDATGVTRRRGDLRVGGPRLPGSG